MLEVQERRQGEQLDVITCIAKSVCHRERMKQEAD